MRTECSSLYTWWGFKVLKREEMNYIVKQRQTNSWEFEYFYNETNPYLFFLIFFYLETNFFYLRTNLIYFRTNFYS